ARVDLEPDLATTWQCDDQFVRLLALVESVRAVVDSGAHTAKAPPRSPVRGWGGCPWGLGGDRGALLAGDHDGVAARGVKVAHVPETRGVDPRPALARALPLVAPGQAGIVPGLGHRRAGADQ